MGPATTPCGPALCRPRGRPERRTSSARSARPLPPAPLYDPPDGEPGRAQAGHWLDEQVPPELGRLQGGAVGGGKQEWEVNLDVAQRTAALLSAGGHRGRRSARDRPEATGPTSSSRCMPTVTRLAKATASKSRDLASARSRTSTITWWTCSTRSTAPIPGCRATTTHISLRMRYYYAFNSRRYCHAVAPGVPQAIVEMGYLTSPIDRQFLIGDPDRLARGLADSIQVFLSTLP